MDGYVLGHLSLHLRQELRRADVPLDRLPVHRTDDRPVHRGVGVAYALGALGVLDLVGVEGERAVHLGPLAHVALLDLRLGAPACPFPLRFLCGRVSLLERAQVLRVGFGVRVRHRLALPRMSVSRTHLGMLQSAHFLWSAQEHSPAGVHLVQYLQMAVGVLSVRIISAPPPRACPSAPPSCGRSPPACPSRSAYRPPLSLSRIIRP